MVTAKIHPKGKSPPRGRALYADKELGLRNWLVNFTSVGKVLQTQEQEIVSLLLCLCIKSCPDCQVIQQSMEQKL